LSPQAYRSLQVEKLRRAQLNRTGWLDYRASPEDPSGFTRWVDDFVNFTRGEGLADYQAEIGTKLYEKRRASARGPHGLGKTCLAALVTLHFIATRPVNTKVVTTASAWRQLTHYLWPEIRVWNGRVDWAAWARIGGQVPEMYTQSLRIGQTCEAFPVASKNSDFIEGAHGDNLLYIFDESKAIVTPTWDAAEGAFASGDCYWLSISTPGGVGGTFWKIHTKKNGYEDWWARHVTLEEAIAAGRVSQSWADDRKRQWGVDSPIYQARVLGNFPDQEEGTLIPLAWIEAARGLEIKPPGKPSNGVDVARFGEDDSAMFVRDGSCAIKATWWNGNDIMQTTGKVKAAGIRANVDEIGLGSGVVDRLREQKFPVVGINVGNAARDSEHFQNLRAELYFTLRDRFKKSWEIQSGKVEQPTHEDYDDAIDLTRLSETVYERLLGELSAIKYTYRSNGKIIIEPKDKMKKDLGVSPDLADACMLAYAPSYRARVMRVGG